MTTITQVTMGLTEKDMQNTSRLKEKFRSRNNAEAVSVALSITSSLSELLGKGSELFVKTSTGKIEKIIITGLND